MDTFFFITNPRSNIVSDANLSFLYFLSADPFSIRSELFLRIDSMVLTDIIDTKEAYDFRSLLTDSKLRVADYFSDIMCESDAEILLQLRHFSDKNKM